jgi:signal transduction histidine kinase
MARDEEQAGSAVLIGNGKPSRPERDTTDESLRKEREKTDRELAARRADAEVEADRVLGRARRTADAVLSTARDEADQGRDSGGPVAAGRVQEDDALRDERAAADESLRQARLESKRALSCLLPLERENTDRHLLTERARSDDALEHRDDFLGIVSHDLRNLLAGIVISADLLVEQSDGDMPAAQIRAGATRVRRYAARMNRLIGDLVDVASIDAGKLMVTPVEADARTAVAEAVDTFQAAAAGKRQSLRLEMAEQPLTAPVDHDRLLQVMANLIANAIKFTGAGGNIRVTAGSLGADVHVSVSDSGPGIPETMLESVFERFWQRGKDDRRGVGLGLYISRSIIEAHGGRIWAVSKPDEGSRFTFSLPGSGLVRGGSARP